MITVRMDIRNGIDHDPNLASGRIIEGVLLFLNSPDGRHTFPMLVSEQDAIDATKLPKNSKGYVTDLINGQDHYVQPAACGLNCFCGLELTRP